MIITIQSIGIIKNCAIFELQEDYKNRINNQGKLIGIKDVIINENRSSKKKDLKARTQEEFFRLTKDKDKNSIKILLDKKGKRVDSENISQLIKDVMENGQNINMNYLSNNKQLKIYLNMCQLKYLKLLCPMPWRYL